MLTQFNSSKSKKLLHHKINKINTYKNRGVDFILNGRKKKHTTSFKIEFPGGKKMSIDTEIDIYFEFSLSVKRKK